MVETPKRRAPKTISRISNFSDMNKILKAIRDLRKRGFATAEEKAELAEEIAKLKTSDQAAIAEDVDEVNELPESDPSTDGDDEDVDGEELEKSVKSLFEKYAAEATDKVTNDVKSYIDQHKELAEQNAGVYHPEIREKRKQLSDVMREFTKAALVGNDSVLKEMSTDATGTPFAGYTVDSELSAEIRHLVTEYGVARREMAAIPLTKHSYTANDLATDVTTYWVDEAGSISSTQAVLGQETLELKKLATIVTLTSELLEDTEIDFVSFLGGRVAEGFAQAEDEAFFKGDGTSAFGSFTGLLKASDVNEVVMSGGTFASITAEDLIDMVDATPAGALANAKYYLHRTIMSLVRKLREDSVTASDGAGAFIYQAPSDRGPATIWGYPAVMVEAMPTKTDTAVSTSFVLFGDLRKACILGFKASGLKVARFDAGVVRNVADSADVNLITTDREAVRWIERTGYIRIIPTAVTKLTTAASA